MARIEETGCFRLRHSITVSSDRFEDKDYRLDAGTVGTVLLDGGDSYYVEFVIDPTDPNDPLTADYAFATLEDSAVEKHDWQPSQ